MAMKNLHPILFICLSIVMMGCPYQSDVEINTYEESLKVDKDLIGNWVAFHDDGSKEELIIEKIAKSVLSVVHKEIDNKNRFKGSNRVRAYATDINGFTIFNIETKDAKYLFLKYAWVSKNVFYMQAVSETYVTNNFTADSVTTENLREFFSEHVNKEEMYEDKLEFYKKGSPDYEKVKMFMKRSGF